MIKVGVNGFGRIGRNFLRAWLAQPDMQEVFTIVAVNDLADTKTLAHLLKYDSVLGPLKETVTVSDDGGTILVGEWPIRVFSERIVADIPWALEDVDLVIESTGFFTDGDVAGQHDADYVIISAPGKNVDFTTVVGVNDHLLDPSTMRVVSNASCTTNCLAPMVKVLDDVFGLEQGTMTTVHAYTNDQGLLDAPHKDLRRARAAALSIIPTSTGAAEAVGLVLPDLAGKLSGHALRVPVPTGSIVDLTATLKTKTTVEDLNYEMKAAADGNMFGVLEYTEDPIVSSDIVGNPASCVFDSLLTWVDGKNIKISGWYDNEWGYSNRLLDLVAKFA